MLLILNSNADSIYPFDKLSKIPNSLIRDIKLCVPSAYDRLYVSNVTCAPLSFRLTLIGDNSEDLMQYFQADFIYSGLLMIPLQSSNPDITGYLLLNLKPYYRFDAAFIALLLILDRKTTVFRLALNKLLSITFTGFLTALHNIDNSVTVFRNQNPGLLLNLNIVLLSIVTSRAAQPYIKSISGVSSKSLLLIKTDLTISVLVGLPIALNIISLYIESEDPRFSCNPLNIL